MASSLWTRHQQILDGEPLNADARQEKAYAESLPLPPLALPERPKASLNKVWISTAAALCLLIGTAILRESGEAVGYKGAARVTVFWERAGMVRKLTPESHLRAGDRVRAEVAAPAASLAYTGIITADGRVLVSAATALDVQPGTARFFPGSFALDGVDEGEILITVVCGAEHAIADAAIEDALVHGAEGCDRRAAPLRRGEEL